MLRNPFLASHSFLLLRVGWIGVCPACEAVHKRHKMRPRVLWESRNPACASGRTLIDKEWVSHTGSSAGWSLSFLLQNSFVRPRFYLIQFPSFWPFLHPGNFIFYFSVSVIFPLLPISLLTGFCRCNFPPFLCSFSSLSPAPIPISSPPCQSALWCADQWCPWPHYESSSASLHKVLLTHNSPFLSFQSWSLLLVENNVLLMMWLSLVITFYEIGAPHVFPWSSCFFTLLLPFSTKSLMSVIPQLLTDLLKHFCRNGFS